MPQTEQCANACYQCGAKVLMVVVYPAGFKLKFCALCYRYTNEGRAVLEGQAIPLEVEVP